VLIGCVRLSVQQDALNPLSKRSGLSTRAPLSSPPRRSSVAGGSGSGSSTHGSPPPRRRTRLQAAQQQSHTLSAALEILFELAFKATFPEQAVHTERGAVLSELQARDTPAYRSEVAYLTQMRPGSLLPARLPIGRKEQIQTWGVTELREFYDTHYRADNLRLYIVGPVDATAALQCAADRFAHAANANPHQVRRERTGPHTFGG
jgi:predicted Zn-dependent peptidase